MTLFETKEWLHDLWNLLVDLNICRINSRRIIESVYENEASVKRKGFFNHYLFQLKFIMAIQLCKILQDNDNQKRNINKLLRRLENETWDKDLISSVALSGHEENPGRQAVIKELKLIKLDIESHKELIESIVKVRNENYAHFDPLRDTEGPSVRKYEEAVLFASQIYNRLSSILIATEAVFNEMDQWEIDPILKSLSKELTDWLKEREMRYGA